MKATIMNQIKKYPFTKASFRRFKNLLRNLLSPIVNRTLVWIRIYMLRQSEEDAYREFYAGHKRDEQDAQKQKNEINIAVASPNLNKYTETFIRHHILQLKETGYYTHHLYGGTMPNAEASRGILLSNDDMELRWYKWKESFFYQQENYYTKKAFVNYIKKQNIKLVLAEFGQCGAEITPLCEEAKVPLMVIFYGYDAHHQQEVQQYKEKYQHLFQYASAIIGVSKDIITKLESLGAPKTKLVHLPCSFNMEIFPYTDHSQNPPILLSIGRFAETKSPHLTILAFNEVLQQIPDARLRMVGKDGGGELFEACHILVRALGIQNKVDFLGILSPNEVYEEIKNARIFVQHSITTPINQDKEGTPVSIMEAMAGGLPIIATRHAGIAEIIEHGKTGILVEEYDYISMAKELIRVCKSDNIVHELGKNASESIRKNELILKNKEILVELIEKYRIQ